MSYTIDIKPANIKYQAPANTTILDAALADKINLQYSCKKGSCGVCQATLLSGQVQNEAQQQVSSGTILTCSSYANSDISLQANYYPELTNIERLVLPCKINQIDYVNPDIMILTLRLPPNNKFNYLPGQYIDLIAGNIRRSYSIAKAPRTVISEIELHIRLLADGELSQILKQSTLNQLMRLDGPHGTFFIRKANNPIIFLAGGTGFAPVKAMVEDLLANKSNRQIYIYWGTRDESSLYTDLASSWAKEFDHIHYIPVISNDNHSWQGRRGLVHQAVLDDFTNLSNYHVYACGSSPMIDAAKNTFITQGLDEKHFYSDAFVPSK